MIVRVFKIILLLIIAQTLVSCYSCECDNGRQLEGFYICDRRDIKNPELLWLFSDRTYIHVLYYDTVQYVNSGNWLIREDEDAGQEYFIAENWVQPCESEFLSCSEKMDYVAKHNFKYYKGSPNLIFGCTTLGWEDECYFRLYNTLEPMYNYKRLKNEFYKVKLDMKKTKFYTDTDSLVFSKAIKKRHVIIE
ncbi:MAG: hypothetical protein ACO1O1_17605 [Adhaeribacter sp.]